MDTFTDPSALMSTVSASDDAVPDLALSGPERAGRTSSVRGGVLRLLTDLGLACLTEVRLAGGRRADVMALSARGEIWIVEVKSCLGDFLSDRKWPDYAPFCDHFYFAVDCDFPHARIPGEAGLMVCDAFGGAIVRSCQPAALGPARRKALTLSFARLAGLRLARAGAARAWDGEPVID
jgi:hypothetical protein